MRAHQVFKIHACAPRMHQNSNGVYHLVMKIVGHVQMQYVGLGEGNTLMSTSALHWPLIIIMQISKYAL